MKRSSKKEAIMKRSSSKEAIKRSSKKEAMKRSFKKEAMKRAEKPDLVPRFPRRIHYVQSVSTSMVVKQILQKSRPSPLSTVGGGLPATKMSPDFSWRDGESRMITRSGKSLPGQGEGMVHP